MSFELLRKHFGLRGAMLVVALLYIVVRERDCQQKYDELTQDFINFTQQIANQHMNQQ